MIPPIQNSSSTVVDHPAQGHRTVINRFRIKVWDLPVRLFHWLLVIAFSGAYITNQLGVAYFKYHEWFGYSIIVLVVFRIFWGFWGSHHARFSNFLRSPQVVWRYTRGLFIGKDHHFAGHNPLGGLMVVLLLGAILIQAITGLFANDEIFNAGALYGYVSNEMSLALTAFHKELFYWISAAIGVHILAVGIHVVWKRETLISAIFTGHKTGDFSPATPTARPFSIWKAGALLLAISAVLFLVVASAPDVSLSTDY